MSYDRARLIRYVPTISPSQVRWKDCKDQEWLRSSLCTHRLSNTKGDSHHANWFPLSAPMERMSMATSLQVILRQAAGQEQRAFVILGFLSGLALSAMIGAVLYVYLTFG